MEKFYYLKSCLAGEAKTLVDSLAMTKANYQVRYNDNKLLKRRQVQALFNLPSLAKESAVELQSLLEGFERTIQTLDQLIESVECKELLLLHILCARLDPTTRRSWEELSSTKEQDTIKDLKELLQRRVKILTSLPKKSLNESLELTHSNRPSEFRPNFNPIQSTRDVCVACFEDHPLYQCPAFQQIRIPERDKVLRNHGLCRNCFKRGHRAMECPSRYVCWNCKGRHHTLLCSRRPSIVRNESPSIRTSVTSSFTQPSERPKIPYGSSALVTSKVSGDRTSFAEGPYSNRCITCNLAIDPVRRSSFPQPNKIPKQVAIDRQLRNSSTTTIEMGRPITRHPRGIIN